VVKGEAVVVRVVGALMYDFPIGIAPPSGDKIAVNGGSSGGLAIATTAAAKRPSRMKKDLRRAFGFEGTGTGRGRTIRRK
jgi:hypothetical protein